MRERLELDWLAETKIERLTPLGPRISPTRHLRRLRPDTFTWALTGRDRLVVGVLSLAWLGCVVWFWAWWLQPGHLATEIGLILNSAILAYLTCLPAYYVGAVNRMRRVRPDLAVPPARVAFVVTRAPSEPWAVAHRTLTAMLSQHFPYPYDVWLCDEQPTDEISRWCATHRVGLSTRWGVETYHRTEWPRRTKCKEGNLAYFYDRIGYRRYDVVSQLDCDHVPAPGYLFEIVRPFADPGIGYVAAPSVCDANAATSWAARGRLYREATFHGPHQLGHNDGYGPVCIGSHYAVRTSALRDIGGLGPELAEDFSTSFLLNAAGWHGAFAIDAEAHGDGPNTFAAMLVQEFQWARSLATLLIGMVPRNLPRLTWRLRLRFCYALSYYTLLVGTTAAGLALGPIAALSGHPWINVNYLAFLGHWWAISVWIIVITLLLRRRGLLRPPDARILSWEVWLYALTRWPFIALGLVAAVVNLLRQQPIEFRVTPKGRHDLQPLPVRIMLPFYLISAACAVAALIGEQGSQAPGYVFLSVLGGMIYAIVSVTVPALHAREAARAAGTSVRHAARQTVRAPFVLAAVVLVLAIAAAASYPGYVMRAFGV